MKYYNFSGSGSQVAYKEGYLAEIEGSLAPVPAYGVHWAYSELRAARWVVPWWIRAPSCWQAIPATGPGSGATVHCHVTVVLNSGQSRCQLSGYKFKLQLDSDLLARVSSQATQAGGIFAKPQWLKIQVMPLPRSLGAEALTVTGRILCRCMRFQVASANIWIIDHYEFIYEFRSIWIHSYEFIDYEFIDYEFIVTYEFIVYEFINLKSWIHSHEFIYFWIHSYEFIDMNSMSEIMNS
jgi:hypothetical protein